MEGEAHGLVVRADVETQGRCLAVALDIGAIHDLSLDLEGIGRCRSVRELLDLLEELSGLRLEAEAHLADPETFLAARIGDERGEVEEAVGSVQGHLERASVGKDLGEGSD